MTNIVTGFWDDIVGGASAITNPLGTSKPTKTSTGPSPLGTAVNTVGTVAGDTFSVTKLFGQASTWKAIGLILAGAIMLILAVVEFTVGGSVKMVPGV